MRMDRYLEDEEMNESKQTRTNKNQELYTDVYLNNVYVDIDNLKEVMSEEDDNKEVLKITKETPVTKVMPYTERNYDIVSIIEETIKNKKDDNLKRSLDLEINNLEIDSLIESINENQKENEENEENLLTDLLPSNENTEVIAPLEEPILDTSIVSVELKEETSDDMFEGNITQKDFEQDDSFVDKKSFKGKIVIIVLACVLVVAIVIGILLYKNII